MAQARNRTPLPSCIFCDNARTRNSGEHVWDNWLNRENGKEIRNESTIAIFGLHGDLIRSYPTDQLSVTLPVVCDRCNNEWMSDISNRAKDILEPSIRRDAAKDYSALDVVTLASFFFLKSAVLDWSVKDPPNRRPCIPRSACVRFMDSFVSPHSTGIAFPPHLQAWVARYKRTHVMEAQAFIDELTGRCRRLKGYRILLITYAVGSFVFQLTCPRPSKETRNKPDGPLFDASSDRRAVAIWPDAGISYWPPALYLDRSTLEVFRQRFRRVDVPVLL